MEDEHEEAPPPQPQQHQEVKIPLKKPPEVKFPKRVKSIIIPERVPVYITPDKITCIECPCFPKESPWRRHPKLQACQQSPLTLYEYAAKVIDRMNFPEALYWSEEEVAQWMDEVVGLPEYKETLIANHINGRRLLWLENMTLPFIGITRLEHMKTIVTQIHKLYSTDFVKFSRSIGLPPRKPLTHCTWFKSRTGPTWGIRQNWSRCDVLRWMKILDPEPVRMNHWDLVWYVKPDFPKTMFARIPPAAPREKIPHYVPTVDICTEYQVPRKYKILNKEEEQYIWDEPRVVTKSRKVQTLSPTQMKASRTRPKGTYLKEKPPSPKVDTITIKVQKPEKVEASKAKKKESRLVPKKIRLEGLAGKDLILARRLMPKQKFMKA